MPHINLADLPVLTQFSSRQISFHQGLIATTEIFFIHNPTDWLQHYLQTVKRKWSIEVISAIFCLYMILKKMLENDLLWYASPPQKKHYSFIWDIGEGFSCLLLFVAFDLCKQIKRSKVKFKLSCNNSISNYFYSTGRMLHINIIQLEITYR